MGTSMKTTALFLFCVVTLTKSLPSSPTASTPSPSNSTNDDFCLFHESADGKKCYQGCADSKFASKGFDAKGVCGVHFNTVDSVQSILQCPDGVTNVKYCQGHEVNVTFTDKGKAGFCYHNEEASGKRCYEACSFSKFKMKDFDTTGFCPDSYNFEQSVHTTQQCPDGVTNVKYCPASVVTVIVRTLGVQ